MANMYDGLKGLGGDKDKPKGKVKHLGFKSLKGKANTPAAKVKK